MWLGLLANMTALAACSRGLSATMDYISGGRSQNWIRAKMGPLPSILGGYPPDFMALAATIVPSVLVMLGLDVSKLHEVWVGQLGKNHKYQYSVGSHCFCSILCFILCTLQPHILLVLWPFSQ
jgi:hypothetical protein